ncbi:MAG: nicotinamide-nucleotide amidohydrolase family protein [Chlamydiales bacterium]|nr:nicotinamide-nucleotide amidohydrolase family protein [Chlamydiia bacterium]MCP5508073.1 nicotinamide-nucleotide amidohydrolase family protein [Chlamydiales bacterium]
MEIITIGNELLSGATINSNAAFLCRQLHQAGYVVDRVTVVGDSTAAILSSLIEAFARTDTVIATGGLGPTVDDVTRVAAAEYFRSDFAYNEQIAQLLIDRYGSKLSSIKDQATLPVKAQLFSNAIGTAQGLLFKEDERLLFLLPGVPSEMRHLAEDYVLPYLREQRPTAARSVRQVHLHNTFESAVDPVIRDLQKKYSSVAFGIYPYPGRVSVTLSGEAAEEVEACCEALASAFTGKVFESSDGTIEAAVHQRMIEKKLTLATAESCTGGAIASRLTAIAGASEYFVGSCVTYSNAMKERLLGVSAMTLQEKGAVSEETVREMLCGLLDVTQADCGIAVSGIAGPTGGSGEKPIGTVWAAVGMLGREPLVWLMKGPGTREMVIDYSVTRTLGELYYYLEK